ncbi:MAG: RNA pseudouridine synthase [Treponemataceae bacterium]|nr:RNA pseudouridine synthase [Treponemataceae bacterium]
MTGCLEDRRVLYVHPKVVVINKQVGEAVEGARLGMVDVAVLVRNWLNNRKEAFNVSCPPYPVHRLDVPVSGAVLWAIDREGASLYSSFFKRGLVRKIYWAVVEKPQHSIAEEGLLVHRLEWNRKANKVYAFPVDPSVADTRVGRLYYRLVGAGDRYLFLEVELLTGKHHQIRSQLAAAGLPIKGDLKYGARRSEAGGGIRLHSRLLAFPDPEVLFPSSQTNPAGVSPYLDIDNPYEIPSQFPRREVVAPLLTVDSLWEAFLSKIE